MDVQTLMFGFLVPLLFRNEYQILFLVMFNESVKGCFIDCLVNILPFVFRLEDLFV